MAGGVFLVVLTAALMHASWNAMAKAIPDRRLAAGLFGAAELIPAGIGVATLPLPEPGSWPFLIASSLLSAGYMVLLMHAYQYGEFGRIYPLARGLPPLLVAVFALVMLGERLDGQQFAGVALVSVALTMLVFAEGRPRAGSGLGLAAATGVLVAVYTVLDGAGVRQSGHALSYAAWRFLLEAPLLIGAGWVMLGAGLWRATARPVWLGLLGGLLAMTAYAVVLWAQARAPLASVSAVRETSLLFAAVIGVLVFRERVSAVRLSATAVAVGGIVLLQTS